MKKHSLTLYIFIGIFLGVFAGWLFGESILPFAEPMAQLFLRLLRMAIMPLIITSILSGVLSVGTGKNLGTLGIRTAIYYIFTSLVAILTGQFLVNVFQPGKGADIGLTGDVSAISAANQSPMELIFRIIPENPFQSMANGDVLPVIFFFILFGFFITKLEDPLRSRFTDIVQASFEAMMKLTHVIIWLAPIGVMGINAKIVATTGFGAFYSLGKYFIVVLMGLFIHTLIVLPLVLKFVGKVKPFKHYRNMLPAYLTAFSTSSSMVALPLTMEYASEASGVSKKISNFFLPIGATINMDGTALYECVATIFIAQAYGVDLSVTQQFTVALTALLASIGAAGIPMAGLVMMSIILHAVGLPLEGVGIIMAVDRILDMFRTTTNVISDSSGVVVVAHLEGESLEPVR